MKDFKGKVAVITGAASGIGYGLAERCAREGMKVVLAGINEDTLKKAEKDIKKTGASTLVVRCDVSKAGDVEALANKTLDAFGAVHLLFNNAGVCTVNSAWESTLADWQWVLGVNLWGVIYGIHYFVPIMLKQDTECYIINTSSMSVLGPPVFISPYGVSKHGVVVVSEALYLELEMMGHKNIGVSVLCPAPTRTRVMDCERNRPAALKNKPGAITPNVQGMADWMVQATANGMPIEPLADMVFSAINNNKFYIIPNFEQYKPFVQMRMDDIMQESNPKPPSPNQ